MSLRLSLVIEGENSGAKQALEETKTAVAGLAETAEKVNAPLEKIPEVLAEAHSKAVELDTDLGQIDTTAQNTGGAFDGFKSKAVGALTGIAAGLVASGLEAAVGVLATKAGEFVNHLVSTDPQIQTALRTQAGLVRDIRNAFAEAEGAASSYGNNSIALLRFRQQQSLGDMGAAFDREQDGVSTGGLLRSNSLQPGMGPAGSPLTGLVADFRNEMREGRADVIAFRNAVAELVADLPENDPNRQFASALFADTEKLAEVQAQMAQAKDLLAGLEGNANAASTALGGAVTKYDELATAAAGALPALRETSALLGSTGTGTIGTRTSDTGRLTGGQFALGGYTGDMDIGAVAGVVHGKEFVVNAAATARHRGMLEAINRGLPGFAAGGMGDGSTPSYGIQDWGNLSGDFQRLSGAVNQLVQDLFKTKDPLASLANVALSVSSSFLNQAIGAVGNAAGSWVSNLFAPAIPAGVGHSGAIIGQAHSNRLVPLSLFANAPRHHTGTPDLGAGERAFIGMEGEEIGWPGDLKRKYGGAGNVTIFNVQTPDPVSFAQSPSTVSRGAGRLTAGMGRHN